MRRRDALKLGLGAGVTAAAVRSLHVSGFGMQRCASPAPPTPLTTLAIAPIDVELARGIMVRSIAFCGRVPGPRLDRGSGPSTVSLRNDCDTDMAVHSTAFAEPLMTLPARACMPTLLRMPDAHANDVHLESYRAYCPTSGAVASGAVASGAVASGAMDFGAMRGDAAGAFDQLHVLSIHRWRPRAITRVGTLSANLVDYEYASFDDKVMSASEPFKVRYGERVRFHFANTSTTRHVTLGLPRHRFLVVALDGHHVPTPRYVKRIYIGPAESVDALVTMDQPGRWILGATHRGDRAAGLGRLVEYAGATGYPLESEYGIAHWDYASFGLTATDSAAAERAAPLADLQLVRRNALADSQLYDPTPSVISLEVSSGKRYRLTATNFTPEAQSLQLLGHTVELVRVAGQRMAGLRKEVVTLPSFTRVEFEFQARTDQMFLAHGRQVSLEQMSPKT